MDVDWLDPTGTLLGARCPLPLDAPFTHAQAAARGVSRRTFRSLTVSGLVRPVLRGVYAAGQAPDDVLMRAQALALVVPASAVVCDRTAAWLHGVDILPRTALHAPPPVQVAHTDDTRVERPGVDGIRRGLADRDVTFVHGVRVTTPLRTALDLGRLLWRYDALAAIDGFLRLGVDHDELLGEVDRFRGYRGVRQLRLLAPLGDRRAESVAESAVRLSWIDAGLPAPELQVWVADDDGRDVFRLDLGLRSVRFGAEYDGAEFHTSPSDVAADIERRRWLQEERGWTIVVLTQQDVYGPARRPVDLLVEGFAEARRSVATWTPRRREPCGAYARLVPGAALVQGSPGRHG